MDNAYAAGIASSSTMIVDPIEALNELISGGQASALKNSSYPSNVSAAASDGGLVAASASLCSEVSTIHATGRKKNTPATQPIKPQTRDCLIMTSPRLGRGRTP